ncbi:hypothetical protein Lal_00037766 [Lupinus albus]|uniref:Putative senescence regulator S40 n=1 Tax=Lupinus albus TaxID=3870 RepID=A0A6A5LD96_LUPAL|nr:putative senescence regulator S40 [Lupinus albus]KAF1860424.1 hypothetical protein Lal_00037766 [Lupinus albus]
MASRKSFLAKPNYIFPATPDTNFNPKSSDSAFDFDEAEVWNISNNTTHEAKKSLPTLKIPSRKVDAIGRVTQTPVRPSSMPVNIPDWSKILKDEYKEHKKWDTDEDDDDFNDDDQDEEGHHGGVRVPPHEYLARTRAASLSVHEGIGRTLKGRDLCSVRNAIWKKVGFED